MNLKNIFNFKRKQKPTPEIREILNLENHSLITFNIIDADVLVKRRRKKHWLKQMFYKYFKQVFN